MEDQQRVGEALLEYNEFLIKYRLSSFNNVVINPNDNTNTTIDSQNLKNIKIKLIQLIMKNFDEFDKIYLNIKSDINIGYIQNLLNLIKSTVNQNDLIESPFYILGQKCNYIKGKFAFACNKYKEALTFFLKSKEQKLISDAKIIKSSNKQIIKILNLQLKILESHEKIVYEYKKKNKEIKTNLLRNRAMLEKRIDELKLKDSKYSELSRDYLVLVNASITMFSEDSKRLKWARQNILHIYDCFISDNDRFALFLTGQTFNTIVNLNNKNETNNEYVKSLINNITDIVEEEAYEMDESDSLVEDSNLFKVFVKSLSYLTKKSNKIN